MNDKAATLAQLIACGERLIETADLLGLPMAGNHICKGVEALRDHLHSVVAPDQSVV